MARDGRVATLQVADDSSLETSAFPDEVKLGVIFGSFDLCCLSKNSTGCVVSQWCLTCVGNFGIHLGSVLTLRKRVKVHRIQG
jgi:hypothetical protein